MLRPLQYIVSEAMVLNNGFYTERADQPFRCLDMCKFGVTSLLPSAAMTSPSLLYSIYIYTVYIHTLPRGGLYWILHP